MVQLIESAKSNDKKELKKAKDSLFVCYQPFIGTVLSDYWITRNSMILSYSPLVFAPG